MYGLTQIFLPSCVVIWIDDFDIVKQIYGKCRRNREGRSHADFEHFVSEFFLFEKFDCNMTQDEDQRGNYENGRCKGVCLVPIRFDQFFLLYRHFLQSNHATHLPP